MPHPTHYPPVFHPDEVADTIAARRARLDDEELGLVGLVPVDRILALAGGIIGGAIAIVAGVALEFHVRAIRRREARP